MLSSILAAAGDFKAPHIDYHAIAPEAIVAAGICLVLVVDLFVAESKKWITATLSGLVLLGAMIPVVTLAVIGDASRSLFDGRYVVDEFALIMKALFLLTGYVVVLLSTNEIEEGGYHQGEYYTLLLSSILGMVMMASARDLISIFVALEFLSIPVYLLASWRKRDGKSNEAGMKYFLIGVFASGVMLYGMSLLFGVTGTTKLSELGAVVAAEGRFGSVETLAIVFVIVGFAFKVSAVPFHNWAPDTYEGAPTPITAFLSVGAKAGGFVALVSLVYLSFPQAKDVWQPFMFAMAALTMTIGNVLALKQTNMVRMLAYSSISQGGFILMPFVVAGTSAAEASLKTVVAYLLVYASTNLGMFAVVIAVSRKTRSGDIASFGGLIHYAPGLAALMTFFLASLAGIPPFGGWFAKLSAFRAVLEADTGLGYAIAIIGAVNTVIAFGYYGSVMREIWMKPIPDGDDRPIRTPSALTAALAITAVATLVLGILPQSVLRFGDLVDLTGAALGR
ncbi:MAG TPA: NADH-quinone oxidoreductase subunit N [Ilumatobacteraceae bacterium]|nr:NADH-quinone oxidoreductase subunit N [Ilumatobacteraceae bacterium]